MTDQLHSFKANIRLKDIIGQGLITNSNIAIIELIKNSKDADSNRVLLQFQKANVTSPASRIIIQDYGTGMSLDGVVSKWLNIAFSGKRNSLKKGDGNYAGDKGIGRFSCDRLGKTLSLYTRSAHGKLVHLAINWEEFEVDDPDKEISFVKLDPSYVNDDHFTSKTSLPLFDHGTCLVIENLRQIWGRLELEKLRQELERFIIDPNAKFGIHLKSLDFKGNSGKLEFDERIENKLLSKIDNKTISVHSNVSKDGKTIKTALRHFGHEILTFEEDNPYSQLKNISAHIHYLSTAGKVSFKSITGYTSGDYSSIMLFLNGFRVMPYGEPKDDWLQLNQRKTQGVRRFLGTRELFGVVELEDHERIFRPIASREGLEGNEAFKQLTDRDSLEKLPAYLPGVLRVLENYVVKGIDWDRAAPKDNEYSYEDIKASIESVIASQTRDSKIRNVRIDEKRIGEIAKEKITEYENFVQDLLTRVSDKSVYELTPAEKRDVKKYVVRNDERILRVKETSAEYLLASVTEKKRRLFAESHLTEDSQRIENMHHLIGIWGQRIQDDFEGILSAHTSGKTLDVEALVETIKTSHFAISKINKLAKIIVKANFNMMSDNIRQDIFSYIEQYLSEIKTLGSGLKIDSSFSNNINCELVLNFSPLEVSMLLDNIISNSVKAEAKKLFVTVKEDSNHFWIDFVDDGNGLDRKFKSNDYFSAGITTTNGSGIGLYNVKQIVVDLEGEVSIASNEKTKGAFVRIRWRK